MVSVFGRLQFCPGITSYFLNTTYSNLYSWFPIYGSYRIWI